MNFNQFVYLQWIKNKKGEYKPSRSVGQKPEEKQEENEDSLENTSMPNHENDEGIFDVEEKTPEIEQQYNSESEEKKLEKDQDPEKLKEEQQTSEEEDFSDKQKSTQEEEEEQKKNRKFFSDDEKESDSAGDGGGESAENLSTEHSESQDGQEQKSLGQSAEAGESGFNSGETEDLQNENSESGKAGEKPNFMQNYKNQEKGDEKSNSDNLNKASEQNSSSEKGNSQSKNQSDSVKQSDNENQSDSKNSSNNENLKKEQSDNSQKDKQSSKNQNPTQSSDKQADFSDENEVNKNSNDKSEAKKGGHDSADETVGECKTEKADTVKSGEMDSDHATEKSQEEKENGVSAGDFDKNEEIKTGKLADENNFDEQKSGSDQNNSEQQTENLETGKESDENSEYSEAGKENDEKTESSFEDTEIDETAKQPKTIIHPFLQDFGGSPSTRSDGFVFDDKPYEPVPDALIRNLIHIFINQNFKRHTSDLNTRVCSSEREHGFGRWDVYKFTKDYLTKQWTELERDRQSVVSDAGKGEQIPLSFYFDLSGSMTKFSKLLASIGMELLKKDVKILVGYNQRVGFQVDNISKKLTAEKFEEILIESSKMCLLKYDTKDEERILNVPIIHNPLIKAKIVKENIDVFLERSCAEKCVVFSDIDSSTEVSNLSQFCDVYLMYFGKQEKFNSYFREKKFNGVACHIKDIGDISRALTVMGKKSFKALCALSKSNVISLSSSQNNSEERSM